MGKVRLKVKRLLDESSNMVLIKKFCSLVCAGSLFDLVLVFRSSKSLSKLNVAEGTLKREQL